VRLHMSYSSLSSPNYQQDVFGANNNQYLQNLGISLSVVNIAPFLFFRLTLCYPVPATLGLDIWSLLVYNIYAAADC